MRRNVTDYLLYRWRYIVGYGLVGLIVVALLLVAGFYTPGGLTDSEMNSVVTSSQLSLESFDPAAIVNLPYHLLQRASLELFGVSIFSIKLPSLVLGAVTIIGMLVLLRMWFRQNVAILTTILVITTGSLMLISQYGAPNIMYAFTSVWILVAAMLVSRRVILHGVWKVILFVLAALSLYTPLSVYILIALLSAVAFHPHLRFIVRNLSRVRTLVALGCAILLLVPLAYAISLDPSIALTLLGVPSSAPDLIANASRLFDQYFNFISPNSGILITPVYGLATMLLIILGVFRLVTTKYTARSYIISAWILLLLPVLLINPSFVSVTFVPVVLLMAMGIATLISSWYRLFPRNPYARIAGLLPLAVLIGGMVVSGIDRYMYGYHYSPETATYFSNDLSLINRELKELDSNSTVLVVHSSEKDFYTVVANEHPGLTVTTTKPDNQDGTIIASHQARKQMSESLPSRIVVNRTADQADRFYIYKIDQK